MDKIIYDLQQERNKIKEEIKKFDDKYGTINYNEDIFKKETKIRMNINLKNEINK